MNGPNYIDDPQHYKTLISKINSEVHFSGFLHRSGYTLIKKSANSLEFQNSKDRIVLHTGRDPVTYFNRNDSLDKGLFFKFLLKRSNNFYEAVREGLKIANSSAQIVSIPLKKRQTTSKNKPLELSFTIAPLENPSYLLHQRGITMATLKSVNFCGRIYNAYPNKKNGRKIANIAFPKYDLAGNPQNYILFNKAYRSKNENKLRKFRLVLNRKDHFLFYSAPIKDPSAIVVGESAVDLLSYHQLHGSPQHFYVSFSGNVYAQKLVFFNQLTAPYLGSKKTILKSIMDNDRKGFEFDIKLLTSLLNFHNQDLQAEALFRRGDVNFSINYFDDSRNKLRTHVHSLAETTTALEQGGWVQWIKTDDKISWKFNIQKVMNVPIKKGETHPFKALIETISTIYLPFHITIHKSIGKDWNDDLLNSQKKKFQEREACKPNSMEVGDKVTLKYSVGHHNPDSIGTIVAINQDGISCQFGPGDTITLPFGHIKGHFKQASVEKITRRNNLLREQDAPSLNRGL
ncbi:toprim domain-containing protein [Arenibacter latericius]|uniref:toprim domain-containing protein n=1 Tax=Arenibacter latericius TaxID=86104 RepID=UPI00047BA0E2|nr:toprim domain-containing protein [Arenibacter latericius]